MVMTKVKNHICDKCGMAIKVPDFDETQPMDKYWLKWERALLKHGWQCHREEFPLEFKSFTQFLKWFRSPEGKAWNRQQGMWRRRLLNGFVTLFLEN